jgi:hypothetical protein
LGKSVQLSGSHRKLVLIGGGLLLALIAVGAYIGLNFLDRLFFRIHWEYLLAGIVMLLLGYLFLTIRLRYLLLNQPGWREVFFANSIGFMLHAVAFFPAMAARTVAIGQATSVPLARVPAVLLIERLLFEQLMRLVTTGIIIILLAAENTSPDVSIGTGLVVVLVVLGLMTWLLRHRERVVEVLATRLGHTKYLSEDDIRSTASSMLSGLEAVRSARRLLISLLLSAISWIGYFGFYFLVLQALAPPFSTVQAAVVAGAALVTMPPAINVMPVFYHLLIVSVLLVFDLADPALSLVYAITLHAIQAIGWTIFGSLGVRQTDFSLSELVQAAREYTGRRNNGAPA